MSRGLDSGAVWMSRSRGIIDAIWILAHPKVNRETQKPIGGRLRAHPKTITMGLLTYSTAAAGCSPGRRGLRGTGTRCSCSGLGSRRPGTGVGGSRRRGLKRIVYMVKHWTGNDGLTRAIDVVDELGVQERHLFGSHRRYIQGVTLIPPGLKRL